MLSLSRRALFCKWAKCPIIVATSSLFIVCGPALHWQYFFRPSNASTNSMSTPSIPDGVPAISAKEETNTWMFCPKLVLMLVPKTRG